LVVLQKSQASTESMNYAEQDGLYNLSALGTGLLEKHAQSVRVVCSTDIAQNAFAKSIGGQISFPD